MLTRSTQGASINLTIGGFGSTTAANSIGSTSSSSTEDGLPPSSIPHRNSTSLESDRASTSKARQSALAQEEEERRSSEGNTPSNSIISLSNSLFKNLTSQNSNFADDTDTRRALINKALQAKLTSQREVKIKLALAILHIK